MSKIEDFLVEIGTEELPLKELQNLSRAFADNLQSQMTAAAISFGAVQIFATPRRLAVLIKEVATQQPEQVVSKNGPSLKASYNADGTPTKAALGFASSCNTSLDQVTTKDDKLYFEKTRPGQRTSDLLATMIEQSLTKLPIKKAMRWGTGEFSFVRPMHWILMLLGKDVVETNIFGIESSNYTQGHRIHCPKPIHIISPDSYEELLETEGKVIASFEERKACILEDITALADLENGVAVIDPDLLNIVTALVEWPVAFVASFNPDFLLVPKECLISSMQDHQKCFALQDKNGKLLPKFILISNLESTDPATVIRGNELVMGARLADAAFYFNKDQQQTLESRVSQLQTVTYQKKLGSLFDKTLRIQKLAAYLAPMVLADLKTTEQAAYLCKADLLTSMVYEFPELQGIMGCYYAKHDQLSTAIADAIQEHYKPRFAQDTLPQSASGICVALADRIDSLVGMFGIDNIPTGEKDPYGLRRQAIAVLRTLIEKDIDLDLQPLFIESYKSYNGVISDPSSELLNFCFERLKAWYLDQGIAAKTFAAVMANPPSNPVDFDKRIKAVSEFQKLPQAESLAAANKRVQNLLAKNPANNQPLNETLIKEPAEQKLIAALKVQWDKTTPLLEKGEYTTVLKSLATLQEPVDDFFEHVMVIADDETLRNNRLNLLQQLRNLFLEVADVSLL